MNEHEIKALIRGYYRGKYEDPIMRMIENNIESDGGYQHVREELIRLQNDFTNQIGGSGSELYEVYEQIRTASLQQLNILCQEAYVLGMLDKAELDKTL